MPTSQFLDPSVMLATNIYSSPGVYALLLGSGVSTGAGIPTGWGVIVDLVRSASAARSPSDEEENQLATNDPEQWWAEFGDGNPLGYSNLLAALAPTQAARRNLLDKYFRQSDEDVENGSKAPSAAHRAIASLVKGGHVRVVVTTNFDRLIEKALEEAGVSPQVIARPEAVAGMTPLAHADATVIKLHGDYADLTSRNTVDELSTYPTEWDQLLDQIFDEYGLLISGWSAEWDAALVAALERRASRRYPIYWDSRSCKGERAQSLVALQDAVQVPSRSADELFTNLVSSLDALSRMAEAPLSTSMAIARIKLYLLDPTKRIDLHDLVFQQVGMLAEYTASLPTHKPNLKHSDLEGILIDLRARADPVLRLLACGVYHDEQGDHAILWSRCLHRLMGSNGRPSGTFQEGLTSLRHYPASLAMRAMGTIAIHFGREDLLWTLLTEPKWRAPFGDQTPRPAYDVLHDARVVDTQLANSLTRWNGTRWIYPQSHLLRDEVSAVVQEYVVDPVDYVEASDRFEYRLAVLQFSTADQPGHYRSASGEYIGENKWQWDPMVPKAEDDFRMTCESAPEDWPWWSVLGGRGGYDEHLQQLRADLERLRKFG